MHENAVAQLIETKQKEIDKFCTDGIKAFKGLVQQEDFDKASSQLDELKKYEKYLPDGSKTQNLQSELDAKKIERKKRFEKAVTDTGTAIGNADFVSADKYIEIARAVDPNDPTVKQFGKDIQRGKDQAAIEDIIKNNGDLIIALAKLDDIKKVEPGHKSIEVLAGKIAAEDAHRKLLASIDQELTSLQAGTGDLGKVTPLVEKLAASDPTRKPREEKAKSARAEFDKLTASIREHLAANADFVAVGESLKAAEKIWRTNPDLPGLSKSLDAANAAYATLIGEIKTDVVPDLANAESKLTRARAMKPADALVKECDGLIAAEKAFRLRLDSMEAAVAQVDKKEDFDAVKKELDDCAAYRKDKRVEAAAAQYDTKFKAYKEKILVANIGKLKSELQELGAYGNGGAYTAWEQRLNEVAAGAPADARLSELRSAYQSKWDIEEARSVIGHARRLVKSEQDYQSGKLGLKELEAQLIASETKFQGETAFAKQREIVDKAKANLKQKMTQVADMIAQKQNLDTAQTTLTEIKAAYPGFEGTDKAERDVTALKAFFDGEVKDLTTKLAADGSLEKLDDRIARNVQMYPRDPEIQALKKKLSDRTESFAKSLATIAQESQDGDLEHARAELAKVSPLFPSEPQLPKLATVLKEAQEGVLKELVDVEKVIDKSALEKVNFVKAGDDMARFKKRLPTDKEVARVEEKRLKIVKDVEDTIPDIEKTLALPAAYDTLAKGPRMAFDLSSGTHRAE